MRQRESVCASLTAELIRSEKREAPNIEHIPDKEPMEDPENTLTRERSEKRAEGL